MAEDNYIPPNKKCDECGERDAVYQWFDAEAGELYDLCVPCRKGHDDD